ncbi:MAG: phosphatidylserine decarboxylase [Epsilonproteobacteria bacterium]|nr:phosphatidylserine decarboxylase [Campylobacterota bacterium]
MSNIISRYFGKFANYNFPFPLQYIINFLYVKSMGVDLSDFDKIGSYKSLNKLFTRSLKKQRSFNSDEKIFISPCDSLVTEAGDLFISRTLQIKGSYYKIDDLIKDTDRQNLKKIYNGKFINLYLSPKDYHRYHAPIDMRVTKAIHVPGLLYSVNLKYLFKIEELFVKNERVILECFTNTDKLFYMVFVGALNVGKMKFNFDDRIQTNCDKSDITTYYYGDVFLKKGEELGRFEMGSTIVMFFEKDSVELLVERSTKIKFGDTIAKLNS